MKKRQKPPQPFRILLIKNLLLRVSLYCYGSFGISAKFAAIKAIA